MDDMNPGNADSLDDLAACLKHVHLQADRPSYRVLEQQTIHGGGLLPGTRFKRVRLTRSIISDALNGRKLPGKAFLLTFVDACGIDLENDHRWEEAWDRLAAQHYQAGAALPSADAEMERLIRENEELRQQFTVLQQAAAPAEGPPVSVPDKASTGTLEILATPISAEIVIDGYLGEFDPTLYGMPGYDDRGNFAYANGFDPRAGEWFKGYEQERDEWEKQYEAARRAATRQSSSSSRLARSTGLCCGYRAMASRCRTLRAPAIYSSPSPPDPSTPRPWTPLPLLRLGPHAPPVAEAQRRRLNGAPTAVESCIKVTFFARRAEPLSSRPLSPFRRLATTAPVLANETSRPVGGRPEPALSYDS